jgi:hypothetical protein
MMAVSGGHLDVEKYLIEERNASISDTNKIG